MKEDVNDIDDLIGKYLAGEASSLERAQVEVWINVSETNQSYFNHLRLIFDSAKAVRGTQEFDVDEAWTKVKSKLSKERGKTIAFPQVHIALRIAALLIITVGLGLLIYNWNQPADQFASLASTNSIVRDSLPDGSLAVLNKATTISYNSNKNERKVILNGEAFFDVKHDEDKPFIIETGGVIIEDIGTSFNVKSVDENPLIEVYVESGEVSLHTISSERFDLVAGETGVFDKRNQLFARIQKIDTNKLAYKTGIFNYRNTALETILSDLNSVYNTKVRVNNEALSKCRLTVIFKNEKIEDIVQIIAETLSLTVTKEGDEFVLDGTSCEN